ncbi:urease subunit beta [Clostridium neuense]|uniref:Urease subunit beta n=1 Tax=Clostridium neuense TaxID=1728934 RepID=A0ABW8TDZ2_9CLOT
MIPGEIIVKNKEIICNEGKRTEKITVSNTGDRPIQVGSHFHFFEVNKALEFDRKAAFGMRLDIASGTAVRFEPGEEKEVTLAEIGGRKEIHGFSGLTEGNVSDDKVREKSFKKAKELGFKGVE